MFTETITLSNPTEDLLKSPITLQLHNVGSGLTLLIPPPASTSAGTITVSIPQSLLGGQVLPTMLRFRAKSAAAVQAITFTATAML